MHDWLGTGLAVAAGAWAVITTLALYGFSTGKFIQKRDDDVDDLRRRLGALAERVTINERALADFERAMLKLREDTNTTTGRLQYKYELLEERVNVQKAHSDERYERTEVRLLALEGDTNQLQRQLDRRRDDDMAGFDPPRRRP